jgi:hypothetical protein
MPSPETMAYPSMCTRPTGELGAGTVIFCRTVACADLRVARSQVSRWRIASGHPRGERASMRTADRRLPDGTAGRGEPAAHCPRADPADSVLQRHRPRNGQRSTVNGQRSMVNGQWRNRAIYRNNTRLTACAPRKKSRAREGVSQEYRRRYTFSSPLTQVAIGPRGRFRRRCATALCCKIAHNRAADS